MASEKYKQTFLVTDGTEERRSQFLPRDPSCKDQSMVKIKCVSFTWACLKCKQAHCLVVYAAEFGLGLIF